MNPKIKVKLSYKRWLMLAMLLAKKVYEIPNDVDIMSLFLEEPCPKPPRSKGLWSDYLILCKLREAFRQHRAELAGSSLKRNLMLEFTPQQVDRIKTYLRMLKRDSAVLAPKEDAVRKPAVIIEHPSAPLKILEATYDQGIDSKTQEITVKNLYFKLQNISNTALRAWGIVWTITTISGGCQEIVFNADNSLPISKGYVPNHIFSSVHCGRQYSTSETIREVTIRLEFADGDGGLVWDFKNSPTYKTILSRRSELDSERLRLIDLFYRGSLEAVKSDLEPRMLRPRRARPDAMTSGVIAAYRINVWQYMQEQGIEGLKSILGIS